MKTFKFITTLAIALIACTYSFSNSKSSNVVKKDFPVSSFSKLEIGGPFNVYIRQGLTEQVYVEADENVMNKVKVKNDGNTLSIDVESFNWNIKKLDVYITLVSVDYMKMFSTGNVESKGAIKAEKLIVDYSRTGNLRMELECKYLLFQADGTGNVDLSGTAYIAEIKKSGVGNLGASNLKVDFLKINASGVGNTSVYATKEISIHSSGVGNLSYGGDATIKEYKVSGVGNVNKE